MEGPSAFSFFYKNQKVKDLKKLLLVLMFALMGLSSAAQSTFGTEFWFGFLEGAAVDQNLSLNICVTNLNTSSVLVTISAPAASWSTVIVIPPDTVVCDTVPKWLIPVGMGIFNKGINISSTAPISVTSQYFQEYLEDAALLYPEAFMDSLFYVLGYHLSDSNANYLPSNFIVVAKEDSTWVVIDPTAPLMYNVTGGFLLSRGQLLQIESLHYGGDLTGSRVFSSKKVSVFAGGACENVGDTCGFCNQLYEQMLSKPYAGMKYNLVGFEERWLDLVRVLAWEDSTALEFNGVPWQMLMAGEYSDTVFPDTASIQSNRPVMVGHFARGTMCDVHVGYDDCTAYCDSLDWICDQYSDSIIFACNDACDYARHIRDSLCNGDSLCLAQSFASLLNCRQYCDSMEQVMIDSCYSISSACKDSCALFFPVRGDNSFVLLPDESYKMKELSFTTLDLENGWSTGINPEQWWVNIMSCDASQVTVNGTSHTLRSAFGGDWFFARIPVDSGFHRVTSTHPFQATLYGSSLYQSYTLAGGWDTLVSCYPLVGLDNRGEPEFLIYPNPVSNGGVLHIRSESVEEKVFQIYSLQGVVMKEESIQHGLNEYEMKLPPGTYFLVVGRKTHLLLVH